MTDEYRTSSVGAPRAYGMGTMAVTHTVGGKIEFGLEGPDPRRGSLRPILEHDNPDGRDGVQAAGIDPRGRLLHRRRLRGLPAVAVRPAAARTGRQGRQNAQRGRSGPRQHRSLLRLQLDAIDLEDRCLSVRERARGLLNGGRSGAQRRRRPHGACPGCGRTLLCFAQSRFGLGRQSRVGSEP